MKLKVVSAVALALSVPALGLAAYSTYLNQNDSAVIELKKAIEEQKVVVADLKSLVGESASDFEPRVEVALEAIVERRRAEAMAASKDAAAKIQKNRASGSSRVMSGVASSAITANKEGQIVYGNPDAEVTVMTFEDFRCSYCAKYHPELQNYIDSSDGKVNWIYKPFPILGYASEQLALAGECVATIEGPEAFWSYASNAYSTQNWSAAINNMTLKDEQAVKDCVKTGAAKSRVDQSLADGRDLNITGTPASVFRNNVTEQGAFIPGYLQHNQIEEMVKEVLGE